MLYHVINSKTNEIIASYDILAKAKIKAFQLNKKNKTNIYVVK